MMTQSLLPFKYERSTNAKLTGLAGLPLFFELALVLGIVGSIERNVRARFGSQGWTDAEQIMALVLLNLAGGEHVDDLEHLEADEGLCDLMIRFRTRGLGRKKRRELKRRWRKGRERAFPSRSAARRYLREFHEPKEEERREQERAKGNRAFIPAANEHLQGMPRVCSDLVGLMQKRNPVKTATIDQDATLNLCNKRDALHCYQGPKAYQPFNTWWAEQMLVLHTEFRDGNVPAGHEQLRCFQEALEALPDGVEKAYLRSDSAGYQHELMRYCDEGHNSRFGAIEFAISADVSQEFKAAVLKVNELKWQTLYRSYDDGDRLATNQQWAEVPFVPATDKRGKDAQPYRYIAIREPMSNPALPGLEDKGPELPFQTVHLGSRKKHYKLFGVVTNRTIQGDELIWWHRERCGKSEELHAVIKNDLAGRVLPAGDFGANAAWWWVVVLTFNLLTAMKRLALGDKWLPKRMKAIRFHIIALPGQVVRHARAVTLKLGASQASFELFIRIRKAIASLLPAPEV